MSLSAVETQPSGVEVVLGGIIDYAVPPTQKSIRQGLVSKLASSVGALRQEQDAAILPLLSAFDAGQFAILRDSVFQDYLTYSLTIHTLLRDRVSAPLVATNTEAGIKALERRFEESGPETIGGEATSEMLFLLPTARRAFRLASVINGTHPVSEADREADKHLASHYVTLVYFGELHVRLLAMLLTGRHPLPKPDVLDAILAGARQIVNMYATVRQAYGLRASAVPAGEEFEPLDDEELELVRLSDSSPWLDE